MDKLINSINYYIYATEDKRSEEKLRRKIICKSKRITYT